MASGIVRSFNSAKGFGLISRDLGGPPLFAHQSAITTPGLKSLKPAQRVTFDVQEHPEGDTAVNIKAAKD